MQELKEQKQQLVILSNKQQQEENQESQYEQEFYDIEEDEKNIKYQPDPEQYLITAKQDKKIKVIQETTPIQENIELFDISLYKGGPLEDKMYSGRKNYRINIRRGNSVCKLENNKHIFLRRGMQKFYDLQYEYFYPKTHKLNLYNQRVKNIIFDPVIQFLAQNNQKQKQYQVNIYKLFKENGEHCQISYCQEINAWLIASKNVTLLARGKEDLNLYKKDRFYWAKLIAEEWFNILEKVSEPENLKKEMNQKTFIGEYCGYEKKQHITIYDKIQIIFYAIVKNNSEDICLPVENAFNIFDQYGLQKVKIDAQKNIDNFDEFKEKLAKIMYDTAIGEMEIEGEGGVVYVVGNEQENSKTLCLCKLKTTEYRIHRKLREMLKKNYLKEKGNKNQSFQFEVQQESKFYPPPKPLEYYHELARLAFQKVDNEKQDWETLRYEYVNFIEDIRQKNQHKLNQLLQKDYQQLNTIKEQQDINNEKFLYLFVTPPAYLSDTNINQLIKYLKIDQIESIYRENNNEIKQNTLIITHMIPRITEKSNKPNIIIILLGITESDINFTKKYLPNNKDQILNSRYSGSNQSVFQFLQSKNLDQSLDLFFKNVLRLKNQLLENSQFQNQLIVFEQSHQTLTENMIQEIFQKSHNYENQELTLDLQKKSSSYYSQKQQQNQSQEFQQDTNQTTQLQEKQESLKDENITLLIVSVFALPGAGKSYLKEQLKQQIQNKTTQFTNFLEISSDQIRQRLMKNLQKKQPKLDKKQLFDLTKKDISQAFNDHLEKILIKISESIQQQQQGKQKQRKIILFIDRNNIPSKSFKLPNLVQEIIHKNQLNQYLNTKNTKNLALVPHTLPKDELQMAKKRFPLSLSLLLHCIERILNKRQDHETMEDDDLESVKVPMKFFLDFKNFQFSQLQQSIYIKKPQQQQNNKQDQYFQYVYPFTFGINNFEDLQLKEKLQEEEDNNNKELENLILHARQLERVLGQGLKSAQKIDQDYIFDDIKISQLLQEFYKMEFQIQNKEDFFNYSFEIQQLIGFLNKNF